MTEPAEDPGFFQAIVEGLGEGVVLTDAQGIIRWASRSIELSTGYSGAEWIGRSILDVMHPGWCAVAGEPLVQRRVHPRGELAAQGGHGLSAGWVAQVIGVRVPRGPRRLDQAGHRRLVLPDPGEELLVVAPRGHRGE